MIITAVGPQPSASTTWHAEESTGAVKRYETGDEDNYSQCGVFFRNVLSPAERERLTDNIADNLSNAAEFLQTKAVAMFSTADSSYGRMIQEKLEKINANKQSTAAAAAANKSNGTGGVNCPYTHAAKFFGRSNL